MVKFTDWIPRFWRSKLSTFGAVLTTISAVILIGMIAADFASDGLPVYTTAFVYLVMPFLFVTGLVFIPVGLWLRRRADKKRGRPAPDGTITQMLGQPAIRRTALVIAGATVLNILVIGIAGSKAVSYMETPEFCGEVCHSIMEPEYRAYQHSPHSSVKCVECHVGEGAAWAVKAKLNGLRQVWEATRGTYSRPIHAPVHRMRTARETCSSCHRPATGHGSHIFSSTRYDTDEANSATVNILLLHLNGLDHENETGRFSGIHWHADTSVEVRYEVLDPKRAVVGKIEVYEKGQLVSTYLPPAREGEASGESGAAPKVSEMRIMDCIDCHNRPTHQFDPTPARALDLAFDENRLDVSTPFLKAVALPLLERTDRSRDGLDAVFEAELRAAYAKDHPDVKLEPDAIAKAAAGVAEIYRRNIWPRMNIVWGTYPSHLRHGEEQIETVGCFRCHNEKHKTAEGKTLSQDCALCHEMLAQEEAPAELDESLRRLVKTANGGD